ncbi:MAG: hypothetical protein K8T26_14915 [Lentisphaerae bacterium]|nr:hypothetical protein [Lentisphaerota bacterium]
METLTYSDLWQVVPLEARARACTAFWRADDELSQQIRPAVLAKLAVSMNFREKFLKAQPDAKKGGLLLSRLNQPAFRAFHGDLVRVLLLTEHSKLIEQFLDVQEIPRRGCFLEGETPPSSESFRKGIQSIRASFGDWNTALYLAFILAQGEDEFWASLPTALAAEGLKVRDVLAMAEPPPARPAAT